MPDWVAEDGTELVVTDGLTTLSFTFDSSIDTAHTAWEAFSNHVMGVVVGGANWTPTLLQGTLNGLSSSYFLTSCQS